MLITSVVFGGWVLGRWRYDRQWRALATIQESFPVEKATRSSYDDTPGAYQPPLQSETKANPSPLMRSLYADDSIRQVTDIRVHRPEGVRAFAANAECFPFLETLSLYGDGIADSDFKRLRQLSRLKRLHLSSRDIDGTGCAELAGLKELESLTVRGTGLTDQGLAVIGELANLKSLHLRIQSPPVTSQGIKAISGLARLEELTLDIDENSDLDFAPLHRLERLFRVQLEGEYDDDAVSFLSHLPEMGSAWLSSTRITDEAIESVCKSDTLMLLVVIGNTTDKGLPFLIQCPSLKDVMLSDGQITDEGEAQLKAARPDLNVNIHNRRDQP